MKVEINLIVLYCIVDYASQYTHTMADMPLKWLFPRVSRSGKRTTNRFTE